MNKVYVVTGGTSGIGKAIVNNILKTSNSDDIVIVNYGHNEEKANSFYAELCEKDKKRTFFIKSDLSSYDGMLDFTKQVKRMTEAIDYLICNTGIGTYMKFSEYTYEIWNKIIDTNMSIPVFMIKEFLDTFSENASIILMGSYAGEVPYSSSVVYSLSKAGLIFASKVLMKELEPKGIRINALAPGFIETDWQKDRSEESRERINNKIALHRFGTPDEVADMCCSLMRNTYVNGSVVDIHGGYGYF